MTEVVRVTDTSTRTELEAAIAGLRAKAQRMPSHWIDRRQEVADEVDLLVDRWIAAEG